jgi:UDP-GlcNAc:undecaprenyl-phosphate/decaprenyl-phosphate GlcNAc-1-phosphate transferase
MSAQHIAFIVAVAAVVTLVVTPLVRVLSLRFGLVDKPGGRKVHTTEVSRLGGIAMFTGFAVALGGGVGR